MLSRFNTLTTCQSLRFPLEISKLSLKDGFYIEMGTSSTRYNQISSYTHIDCAHRGWWTGQNIASESYSDGAPECWGLAYRAIWD